MPDEQPLCGQVAPSGEPVLSLHSLSKSWASGGVPVEVLHHLSLEIFRGEFVAIVGQSGSGKTTLMNILGCLDRATSGRYLCNGRDVSTLDQDELASLRRDTFGFVFQQYHLLATATAVENVELPAIYAGLDRAQRDARAAEILCSLGLQERLGHRPMQLSGGQQQRVSIARALMNGGAVLLADEPTGALDSRSGKDVMELLHQLNRQGHTIIVITHDPSVAAQARRVITLADGEILSDTGAAPAATSQLPASQYPASQPPASQPPASQHRDARVSLHAAVELAEAARMALRSLRANLFRTVLTLLGIVIGVGSVVAMLAFGEGAKRDVLSGIQAMGTNLLLVRAQAANTRGVTPATLTPADADEIAKVANVSSSVPEISGSVTVRYGNVDYSTTVTATSHDYTSARDWPVDSGIFFSRADTQAYAPVMTLGTTVAAALFPGGEDPVGKYVLVNNVPFQVIGVMASKGASPMGSDRDDVVFVPLSTGSLRLLGQRYLRNITVQVDRLELVDETQQAISDLLASRHRTVDFQIRNMSSILDMATATQNSMTVMLGSIAFISLLVGGIGVMNIMLVSVIERTREIGIRMAVGARPANILVQFITEAVVVCALGGVLGVAGGIAVAVGGTALGMPAVLTPLPMVLAFGSAFMTGLVFGYMPARKAAALDPVQALATG